MIFTIVHIVDAILLRMYVNLIPFLPNIRVDPSRTFATDLTLFGALVVLR